MASRVLLLKNKMRTEDYIASARRYHKLTNEQINEHVDLVHANLYVAKKGVTVFTPWEMRYIEQLHRSRTVTAPQFVALELCMRVLAEHTGEVLCGSESVRDEE